MTKLSKAELQHFFSKKVRFAGMGNYPSVKKVFKDAEPTDAMWEYDDIGMFCGTAGYILVRDGQAIDMVITMRS